MKKERIKGLFVVLCTLLLLQTIVPLVLSDNGNSIVSIQPQLIEVGISEQFTIHVYCTPSEPMKSFECSISFNPELISVIDVREGTMFEGYETFFNKGTIDNTNGDITMIYGLILGEGNVSDPGSLISIDIESKHEIGQSDFTLFNVGITNETVYLPITISHGAVEIAGVFPTIQEISINHSEPLDCDPMFGWYRIDCSVIDDQIDEVYLLTSFPNGTTSNLTMNKLTDEKFFINSSCNGYGSYHYEIYAVDIHGNGVSSNQFSFIIPPNWDVNKDGYASVLDFTHISNHVGKYGPPGWMREDVNNNGIISLSDFVTVSSYYKQYW